MIKHFNIRVYGRVQGVGFRYAVSTQARALGLKGWVENQPDGSVTVAIQGKEVLCKEFIQWCRKGGGYSWVEKIDILEKDPVEMKSFKIIH